MLRRADEAPEQGMGPVGTAFQLRMELPGHKPGVPGQLDHLHQAAVGGQAGEGQPRLGQRLTVVVVELIPVAVALLDLLPAVDRRGQAARLEPAGVAAKAHGAPLSCDPHLVVHQVDDGVGGGGIQLPGVGAGQAAHMPGKLHHRQLHPQADAQEGHLVFPGVADGGDLALHPPVAKAAGHQHALHALQHLGGVAVGDQLGVHPADVHLHIVLNAAVGEGLHHGQVGVVQGHILAHQGDGDAAVDVLGPVDHGAPLGQVRGVAVQPQPLHHHVGQPLPLQHQGHLVEDGGGEVGDGVLHWDVAEQGDLLQDLPGDGGIAAAQDHVGLDAQAQKLLGRMLGGLALQLPRAGDGHDEGDVEEHHVLPPPLGSYLADGLQEGLGLNVAHGAADLHDSHVGLGALQGVDVGLDLPGDVGDDLHRGPQVVPCPLPVEHVPVHLARGHRGVEAQVLVDESLVVAQVQVGLRPVVGDEHLTVLIGAHGAWIHVEIGVQFLHPHPQPPLLEQAAQGCGGDALAQPGHHAAGDKDEFRAGCHCVFLPRGRRGPFAPGRPCPALPILSDMT